MAYRSTILSTQAAVATWKALYVSADGDALAAGEPHPAASEAASPEAEAQSPEALQAVAAPDATAPAAAAATLAQE
jgi:hypothetical protein